MIIDFLILNLTGYLSSYILLNIFYLNNKKLYYLLFIDLIINHFPYITFIIIVLYYLTKFIFKYFNNNFINKYILIIIYYFIFNIILYSIFNQFSIEIINHIIKYLPFNIIILFIGLKYQDSKYNLEGEIDEQEKIY